MRFVETLAVGWQRPPCLTAATSRPHEHTAQQIRMRNRLRKRRFGCHAGGRRSGNDALVGCAAMRCLPCLPPHFTRMFQTRSRYRADTKPLLHLWQDTAAGVEPKLTASQVCRHLSVGPVGRKQNDVCACVSSQAKGRNVESPVGHARRGRGGLHRHAAAARGTHDSSVACAAVQLPVTPRGAPRAVTPGELQVFWPRARRGDIRFIGFAREFQTDNAPPPRRNA